MPAVIYEPRGKAREYSPLACNLYLSCTHNCKYCYAPHALQRKAEGYFCKPTPRRDILDKLEADLKKQTIDKQVLLSFIGDVYCETEDNSAVTREALKLFLKYKTPVAILTKGGSRCLKDLDLFLEFGKRIQIGATLTFIDPEKSQMWESGAMSPLDRLKTLKTLRENGITTFASFEPVIEPEESLSLIEASLLADCVDIYKVGKLNNYKGLDKQVNWTDFLQKCVDLIRPAGKRLYIKQDLRAAAPSVVLQPEETQPDLHAAKGEVDISLTV